MAKTKRVAAMSDTVVTQSRAAIIALWVVRIIVAGLFLFAAFMKLIGTQMEIDVFNTVGLGQWFRYVTGLMELIGAVTLLIPAVSAFGAVLLLIVDIGAFIAQVTSLHMDWIHPIVIGVILGWLIFIQRRQILNRLNG
jgi:putative oxidoreductase